MRRQRPSAKDTRLLRRLHDLIVVCSMDQEDMTQREADVCEDLGDEIKTILTSRVWKDVRRHLKDVK